MRRFATCALALILCLMPSALVFLVALVKGQYLLMSGPPFWRGAHAGEQERLSLEKDAHDAVEMLRRSGTSHYSITKQLTAQFVEQDIVVLRQRTIEVAWPIKPVQGSRFVLKINSETVPNCTLLDSTDKVSLCVRE